MVNASQQLDRVSTGIASLDSILQGGLPKGELYVVNGVPGSGKTVLALHFLQAGAQAGEKVLCIALSQRVESLKQTAFSVNIQTDKILFQELSSAQALKYITERQTIFDTSEIELEDTMTAFAQAIEEAQPSRVVFDSISYLRLLANDPLTYRRQILTLRDYLSSRDITVMLTDTQELAPGDKELEAIAHGVIRLSTVVTDYGDMRRYLYIAKIRGSNYRQGNHDMKISEQGLRVYPILSEKTTPIDFEGETVTSGVKELDILLGGGLQTGTSCLLLGPSGTGKTSTATLFAQNFMRQGAKASFFLFDELVHTLKQRSAGLGMDLAPFIEQDQVRFHEINLNGITPGRLLNRIRRDVIDWGAKLVIIDTLTGYFNSMPSEQYLLTQMHELLLFLSRQGVLSFLVVAQHGVVGSNLEVPVDISYLADTVLLLRHFEAEGSLRQAISVYKKRYGSHEKRIRALNFQPNGIQVGEPLSQFTGILSGMPNYVGESRQLFQTDD